MISELETFAGSEDNADVDVLFVVLMAHGGKWNRQEFLKPADGKAFIIRDELEKIFNNKKYPALIDKPKIFIIQMCRGGRGCILFRVILISRVSLTAGHTY